MLIRSYNWLGTDRGSHAMDGSAVHSPRPSPQGRGRGRGRGRGALRLANMPDVPDSPTRCRRFSLSSGAKPCPHLFMAIYHYLIVPQPLMYSMVGCLNQMRPPFVPHQLNPPTGPATNSLAPNCPINVSTSACA